MNRRSFLHHALVVGTSASLGGPTLAEMLEQTARQTAGPFYPDRLPLDRDNDLVIVDDHVTLTSRDTAGLKQVLMARIGFVRFNPSVTDSERRTSTSP